VYQNVVARRTATQSIVDGHAQNMVVAASAADLAKQQAQASSFNPSYQQQVLYSFLLSFS
jgi:hypothetical protein